MIFPINIELGFITLPIHLITDILAFYIGYKYYQHLRNREGDFVSAKFRFKIIIGAALGALIGSRLLASLENPEQFIHPFSLLYYYANKTIVGGIIGGIIGVELTKKVLGIKIPTGDLFTLPLVLGMIIGRVGCLMTGVTDGTVGNPSSLPWAFDQGDGIARHPTSLYEIIFLLVAFFVLKRISHNIHTNQGMLFRIFVISYLIFRFLIEFIKPVQILALGLSSIQIVSLVFSIYYIYSLVYIYKYRSFGRQAV